MRVRTVLLIAVLFLSAAVRAEEQKPSEMYAEKEASFLRAIAAKYVGLGDDAKKMKLYQFAREAYLEAIAYEEHNRDARKALGYVRKGRDWEIDPDEAKNLPEKNTRPQNMTDTEFNRILKDFETLKAKAEVYAARKYAGLGSWCQKEGLLDQAKKAWEKAIKLDSDNEAAREGLGYEKVDGEWITEKQKRAREEAKEGKVVDDVSRFEGPLGVKLYKMESAHFRVETVFPIDILKDYVKTLETAYAYFQRDVGVTEGTDMWGTKALFVVLGTTAQWHKWVDLFGGGSAADKEFTKKTRGSLAAPNLFAIQYEGEDGTHASTLDGLVHKAAHMLAHHYWGIDQSWLLEGFAYYYTVKVLNSTHTHCVARGTYDNPNSGEKDWGQSENWKELVKKDDVDHADPDVRMFYKQTTADLQYQSTVKAWSMISWLFDTHREKFQEWLEAVGKKGQEQDVAMKEILGWTPEELDKEWRDYVIENY